MEKETFINVDDDSANEEWKYKLKSEMCSRVMQHLGNQVVGAIKIIIRGL